MVEKFDRHHFFLNGRLIVGKGECSLCIKVDQPSAEITQRFTYINRMFVGTKPSSLSDITKLANAIIKKND